MTSLAHSCNNVNNYQTVKTSNVILNYWIAVLLFLIFSYETLRSPHQHVPHFWVLSLVIDSIVEGLAYLWQGLTGL